MTEHFKGKISERRLDDGTVILNAFVLVIICNVETEICLPVELLIDTGCDRTMISYDSGKALGLKPLSSKDKVQSARDANNRKVEYVTRKVDLYVGETIVKKNMTICWCISPHINRNFLGMDFFDEYKLIIVGGKNKSFHITRVDRCVKCKN